MADQVYIQDISQHVGKEITLKGWLADKTDKGRLQAQALAQKLQTESITHIYASPILRAAQTAEILAQALGMPYQIADALREYDCGELEGKSYHDHKSDYVRLFTKWLIGKWDSRFEGGESLLDIRARFVPFIEQLIRESSATDHIALISHGGTLLGTLPTLLKNVDHKFALTHPFENADIVIAESTPDGLVCSSWCNHTL